MNNLLDIKTPAQAQAWSLKSDYGLDNHGLANLHQAYWNLPTAALYEEAIFRREALIAKLGPLVANTGEHTGRSANDKFVVREPNSEGHVWWGQYNRPFAADKFNELFSRLQGYLQGRDLFVQDCYVGADPEYRMPVRIVTEHAWHTLFARNMFILPKTNEEHRRHVPDFTVIDAPGLQGHPADRHDELGHLHRAQLRAAALHHRRHRLRRRDQEVGLHGDELPAAAARACLPMHCSANVGKERRHRAVLRPVRHRQDDALGRPGPRPDRRRRARLERRRRLQLRGRLLRQGDPPVGRAPSREIYATTRRFGTILENVVYRPGHAADRPRRRPHHREHPRLLPARLHPQRRCAAMRGGHPKNIVMLTCDASGVLPPIARLTPEQAMYHFLSGYTAKIAGTEVGLGKEPEITFSACFGGPFMVHHPSVYAELLSEKIQRTASTCWLVNTGWTGGPYGIGKRISIHHTRALLERGLSRRALEGVDYLTDPVFGFEVPKTLRGGAGQACCDPASSWPDKALYMAALPLAGAALRRELQEVRAGLPARRLQGRADARAGGQRAPGAGGVQ